MFYDIIIIGGGAAGLMAAYGAAASVSKPAVLVLEKMPRPGRKIMITGKGRCNFTNLKDWNEFSKHIRGKSNFLKASFYNLTPERLLEFMNGQGLETVVERGDRAFPASHKSSEVVDTLQYAATKAGAVLRTDSEVCVVDKAVEKDGEVFTVSCKDGRNYSCRCLIVATGGLSYPSTGSSGDGYVWAKQLGHSIADCFPSLTALVPKNYKLTEGIIKDSGLKAHIRRDTPLSELGKMLCGIQLKNVSVSLAVNGTIVQNEMGDIDFTDGGIEGPIGFSLSRNCVKAIINGAKTRLEIDMKAGVEETELKSRIKRIWSEIQNDPRSRRLSLKDMLKVLLGKLMPWNIIPAFMKCNPEILSGRRGNEHINMDILAKKLKSWSFDIAGYVGYERCVVTAGGVKTDEVTGKTMESKVCKGLYLCGEVLDVDSDTGGYNLHSAFASGFLAGQSAAKTIKD